MKVVRPQPFASDAEMALRFYLLMATRQPEGARLEALIRVAIVRLCKFRSADDVAAMLRAIAANPNPSPSERLI